MIVAGVLHAQRIENVFFQNLFVGFAGNFLDNGPQKKVAGVTVNEFGSRLEFEIAARVRFDEIVDREGIAADVLEKSGQRRVTGNARGVAQQIVNCHFRAGVLAIVGKIIDQFAIQFDLALLN